MGFGTTITQAIATTKRLMDSLLATITLETFKADSYDKRTYNAAVSYKVILDKRSRYITVGNRGDTQLSVCSIQFLEPVTIGELDRITLPDGSTPQILSISGVADSAGAIYAPQVFF